ncbi:TonB-dependent siderophore receptor [Sphingomonas sp. DT-204]|uniref:TonB-dependent siderophore receptor n=1 Tax=Sphingomonas sp. DT-204 TaxID=3396166 RepID=UPI003F1C03B3
MLLVRGRPVLLSCALAAIVVSLPAVAQSTAGVDTGDLGQSAGDDILVTARTDSRISVGKSDSLLIETPQSVSVVEGEFLEAINAKTLSEGLTYTPGFVAQPSGFSRTADDITIRGFNATGTTGGMLRDGLKLMGAVYGGGQEPYGLERIEVLRGAASVLYGQMAPGGVINAVSKQPLFSPFAEVRVEYGNYDRKQLSADISGPLNAGGTIAARLTGLVRDADTWVDDVNDDKRYVAPALSWKITPDTMLTVLGFYQEIRTRFAPPLASALVRGNSLPLGLLPRDRFIGEPDFDRYDADQWAVGYQFSHRFSDAVTIEHSLRRYEGELEWDYLTQGAINPATGDLARGVSARSEKTGSTATDTRLKLRTATGSKVDHEIMIGFDGYFPSYRRDRYAGRATPINIYDPVYGTAPVVDRQTNRGDETRARQYGVYLQDQLTIDDRWVLVLGGRQDWSRSKVRSLLTGASSVQEDDAFTWRAGLVHRGDSGFAPYVSYSRSFLPQAGTDRNGERFEPTEGEQFEGGVRYQPAGTRLLVSAAVYQLTQKNALTIDPVDTSFSVQTGEIRSRGFEFEGQAEIARHLNALFSYSYTDAKITRSNVPAEVGRRVDAVPRHQAAFWADYGFDGIGVPGLKLGAGVRYVGKSALAGEPVGNRSYTLVDANLSYEPGPWRFMLSARNLFDKDYVFCVAAGGCRYSDPRVVSVSAGYRF